MSDYAIYNNIFADSTYTTDRLQTLLGIAIKEAPVNIRSKMALNILEGKGVLARLRRKVLLERAHAALIEAEAIDIGEDGQFVITADWASIIKILIEVVLPLLMKLFNP